jgi:hypothetical protein
MSFYFLQNISKRVALKIFAVPASEPHVEQLRLLDCGLFASLVELVGREIRIAAERTSLGLHVVFLFKLFL